MDQTPTPPPVRGLPGLFALCIFLWVTGAALLVTGVWLMVGGQGWQSALPLAAGALAAAAGLGIYRLRRWGVVIFGGLALAGSANHLARTFNTYTWLSFGNLPGAAGALVSILAAIAIPVILIYVTLVLWKQTR